MFTGKNKGEYELQSVIKSCIKNKRSGQEELFRRYFGFAKSIALRYASNPSECEEMFHDGFLKVFANLKKYDMSQSFEAWFRTVVVRKCVDYHRKYHNKMSFHDVDEMYHLAYEDDLLDRLNADEILGLIQRLSPTYRAVFSLFVVEGYSHAEIGILLEINESTSRSNLAKARMKMQEMIKLHFRDIKDFKNV